MKKLFGMLFLFLTLISLFTISNNSIMTNDFTSIANNSDNSINQNNNSVIDSNNSTTVDAVENTTNKDATILESDNTEFKNLDSQGLIPRNQILQETFTGPSVETVFNAVEKGVKYGEYSVNGYSYYKTFGENTGSGSGEFNYISGSIVINDKVFVSDLFNTRVQVFDVYTGEYLYSIALTYRPRGLGYDKINNYLLIAENTGFQVSIVRLNGSVVNTFSTGSFPTDVAVNSSGYYYVSLQSAIKVYNSAFTEVDSWSITCSPSTPTIPSGVAVDSNNDVFVVGCGTINKYTSSGTSITSFGSFTFGTGYLSDLNIDSQDRIFFGANLDDYIQIWDTSGNLLFHYPTTSPNSFYVTNSAIFIASIVPLPLVQKIDMFIDFTDLKYFIQQDLSNTFDNDGVTSDFTHNFDNYVISFDQEYSFYFYDIKNPRDVTIDLLWELDQNSVITQQFDISLSSTASYSANEFVVYVTLAYYNPNTLITIKVFDTGNNTLLSSESSSVFFNTTIPTFTTTKFDVILAQTTEYSSNLRPQVEHINSDRFEQIITIENFEYSSSITIKAPLSWNFSYINPTATVTLTGNDYVITNTVPVFYQIYFISGSGFGRDYTRQKQILAISDVTNDYLEDPSFEVSWNNDWEEYSSFEFTSISLNYSIVSSGIASWELYSSSLSRRIVNLIDFTESGQYYVSFDYYYQSPSGILELYVYGNDGNWQRFATDSTANRWNTMLAFVDFSGVSSGFRLDSIGTFSGTIFIENFKINKVNTVIETFESSETTITSNFNYWTSYGLFDAINENVTLQLRDRTANTLIDSYSVYTDFLGNISWIWKGNFESKEYELRSIAWNSYFGVVNYWELFEADNWQLLGVDYSVESTFSTGIQYEYDDYYWHYWDFRPDTSFDLTNIDYITYEFKSNVTSTSTTDNYLHNVYTDPSNLWNYGTDISFTTVYSRFLIEIDSLVVNAGNPDLSDVNIFQGYFVESVVVTNQTYWIKDFKVLQAQKYYFTPNTVGFTDYAESELLDAWDFSEGDLETFTEYGGQSLSIDNGNKFIKQDILQSSTNVYLFFSITIPIDTSYYTHLSIRLKTNTSSAVYHIRPENQGYVNLGDFTVFSNTSYSIIEWDLSSDAEWVNSISSLIFHIGLASGSGVDNDSFWIDYIKLIHKDSSLSYGYNWKFEEDNYLDGFIATNEDAESVSNGYFQTSPLDSSQPYIHISVDNLQIDTAVYTNVIVEAKMISTSTRDILFYIENQYDANYYQSFTASNTWQIFNFDISAKSDLSDNWIRIYLDDSGAHSGNLLDEDQFLVRYVRFISDSSPNLYEADSYFVLQNEESLDYNIWIDDYFQGVYSSNQQIQKNSSFGSHTFRYQAFKYSNKDDFVISSAVYEYSYELYEIYSPTVSTFILSSDFVSIYYSANKDTSHTVYENDTSITSGSSDGSGVSVEWSRNKNVNFVNVGIKLQNTNNASEFVWFNTSYGNELVITITRFSGYTNSTHVIIDYTTQTSSISAIVTEDGDSKGSYSSSPIGYTKSLIPGLHAVTVEFTKTYFIGVSFSFTYSIDHFSIISLNFYVDSSNVNIDWVSDQSSVSYTVKEDNIIKSVGTSTSISYSKSSVAGDHFVQVNFGKANHNNLTYLFVYSSSQFSISSQQFFTNATHIVFIFNSVFSGITAYLYESNVLKNSGSNSVELAYSKSSNVGTYYVSVEYTKTDHSNLTSSFFYEISNFRVTNVLFYTNNSHVLFNFDTDSSGVSAYLYESSEYKVLGVSGSTIAYSKGVSIGDYYVSINLVKNGHSNSSYLFTYNIAQFVVTSVIFYSNDTHYFLDFNTDQSNVNVTVYDDSTLKFDSSNTSYILEKTNTEGLHYVSLIWHKIGHNNITNLYSYSVDELKLTNYLYYIRGREIIITYNLTKEATLNVYNDYNLTLTRNSDFGNITITANTNAGEHSVMLLWNTTGYSLLEREFRYFIAVVVTTNQDNIIINPTPVNVNAPDYSSEFSQQEAQANINSGILIMLVIGVALLGTDKIIKLAKWIQMKIIVYINETKYRNDNKRLNVKRTNR